jgi:septum formation inhibitor MinC
MATPAETCARLLAALEDLVAQEAALMRAADFTGVLATQERAAPLVERLAALAATADAAVRIRVSAVLALRSRSLEWLGAEMARVRTELQSMQVSRRRVAQIAPVYGTRRPTPAFSAQG